MPSSDLSLGHTGSLYQVPARTLTSMGSTSWAITTSWAFLFSTRVVTVLIPKKQVIEKLWFRSVYFQSFHISLIQPAQTPQHSFVMKTSHIRSVTQRRYYMDNLLKLRVKKLVYFALHFELRWRNSYIIAIACPILFGWSKAPTLLISFLSNKAPHSHIRQQTSPCTKLPARRTGGRLVGVSPFPAAFCSARASSLCFFSCLFSGLYLCASFRSCVAGREHLLVS